MFTQLQELIKGKEEFDISVVLDEQGYIKAYAVIGKLIDGIDVNVSVNDIEAFRYVYDSHKVIDGKITLDEERLQIILNEEKHKTREELLQEQVDKQQREIDELKELMKGVIANVRND